MNNEQRWYANAQPSLVSVKDQKKMDEVVIAQPDASIDHLPIYDGHSTNEGYSVKSENHKPYDPYHDPN